MKPTGGGLAGALAVLTLCLAGPGLAPTFSERSPARYPPELQLISDEHHIPLVAIAGVVEAERALNLDTLDRVQDRLFRVWLRTHSEEWWTEWAHRNERLAMRAQAVRLIANKWPANLVATGYVFSVGPAQLTPRRVLHACREASSDRPPCDRTTKSIMARLLSHRDALALAGVVLDAEARGWEHHSEYPVRSDVALLGTLYSMGGDYYRHRHPDLRVPVYNRFGLWIARNCRAIAASIRASASECGEGGERSASVPEESVRR